MWNVDSFSMRNAVSPFYFEKRQVLKSLSLHYLVRPHLKRAGSSEGVFKLSFFRSRWRWLCATKCCAKSEVLPQRRSIFFLYASELLSSPLPLRKDNLSGKRHTFFWNFERRLRREKTIHIERWKLMKCILQKIYVYRAHRVMHFEEAHVHSGKIHEGKAFFHVDLVHIGMWKGDFDVAKVICYFTNH